MASLGKTVFNGGSGKAYRFKVYPLGAKFRKISGLYVISNRSHGANGGYRHAPLYVGHTEDLSSLRSASESGGFRRARCELHLPAIGRLGRVSPRQTAGSRGCPAAYLQ